jgi:hypothetical protein
MRQVHLGLILFAGFAAFIQGSASADVSALQGHILFTRAGGRFGDETLYVSKADGTSQRRISNFGNVLPMGDAQRFVNRLRRQGA